MARIVILFLLGLGIYLLLRHFFLKPKTTSQRSATPSRDTVQCLQCKTYVPRDEAITEGDRVFCCKQHARDWKPKD
jgi:hypothetical protein